MQYVLFLCTGNFFRSRFAEILFNHIAQREGLPWRAESRALAIELGCGVNVGPVSQHVLAALTARAIGVARHREPASVKDADFTRSALVIALKEAEHRPFVQQRFPQFASRVKYWHVHDIDQAKPEDALAQVERLVLQLIQTLRSAH